MLTPLPQDDHEDPTVAELIAARPHLAMHAMDGLVLEGVPLAAIADAVGTPTWVYGAGTMGRGTASWCRRSRRWGRMCITR